MKVGVAIASVCAVIISTYFVVLLVAPRKIEVVKTTAPVAAEMPPTAGEDFPPLSKHPPYPKAVIAETEVNFGRMEVGEERSHEFVIRNEGDAPLLMRKGPTTCQCTVSDLETGELGVGSSAKILLKWKPVVQAEQFAKGAEIRTNDPEHRSINLRIIGMVAPRLLLHPPGIWETPDVLEGEASVYTGAVFSPVADAFQVVALNSSTSLMTAETLPLDKQSLEAMHGQSGHSVRVTVSPDVPIGPFNFPLKIKTDLPLRTPQGLSDEKMEVEVLVTGHRRGPIRIVGGSHWDEKSMTVTMGTFDAKAGRKVTLSFFVRGPGAEEFQFVAPPQCDPQALQVKLERDEKSKGKQGRFLLTVEYPPGAPRASHRSDNPGSIRLRTNLPGAADVTLSIFLAAI
jgi:hypothetical protein